MARLTANYLRRMSLLIISQRMAQLTTTYPRMVRLMAHNLR